MSTNRLDDGKQPGRRQGIVRRERTGPVTGPLTRPISEYEKCPGVEGALLDREARLVFLPVEGADDYLILAFDEIEMVRQIIEKNHQEREDIERRERN